MDIIIDEIEGNLWVAAVKNKRLFGLEIDAVNEEVRWGSLYRAKIIDINKAMDAAFVDLDEDNIGLLHNADTFHKDADGHYKKGGGEAIGKKFKAGDLVTVQAKGGYLLSDDEDSLALEDKSVRVSMNITLPGRHLIFSPMMEGNRISKRIIDKKQRKQLTKMLENVDDIQGCILRASASNVQTDILSREGTILKEIWERLQEFITGTEHGIIMEGPDAIARTLSNHAAENIDTIDAATYDPYIEAEEWCDIYAPDLVARVKQIEDLPTQVPLALIDQHDLMSQIEEVFQPYILLKGGGNIIIQDTAALCAIDINRGSDTSSNLSINLKAVEEIGRQTRITNLGGIIIIDFLKMNKKAEKQALLDALTILASQDPCTVQVHGFTTLGLIELTRERRTPPLQDCLEHIIE